MYSLSCHPMIFPCKGSSKHHVNSSEQKQNLDSEQLAEFSNQLISISTRATDASPSILCETLIKWNQENTWKYRMETICAGGLLTISANPSVGQGFSTRCHKMVPMQLADGGQAIVNNVALGHCVCHLVCICVSWYLSNASWPIERPMCQVPLKSIGSHVVVHPPINWRSHSIGSKWPTIQNRFYSCYSNSQRWKHTKMIWWF